MNLQKFGKDFNVTNVAKLNQIRSYEPKPLAVLYNIECHQVFNQCNQIG